MTTKKLTAIELIAKAESYGGIRAGIASLKAVLQGPSYQADPDVPASTDGLNAAWNGHWPARVQTALVLGLHHPEADPRLDYWERGNTWGNRRLREISKALSYWLSWTYQIPSYPLPYHVEKGGLFLKDAAVLSGIGIIGRNNLFLHPEWGPRIRLRAILLEKKFKTTGPPVEFSPCKNCKVYCQKACPVQAFPRGRYSRPICNEQMNANLKEAAPVGETGKRGKRNIAIRYCRACEMACPVGA